jgi:hypothetical protein
MSGTKRVPASIWAKPGWPIAPRLIEEVYDLQDALMVGGAIITLLNNSDRVKAACLAQLVNVIGPILTEPGGAVWRQTIFHPFKLATKHAHGSVLRTRVYSTQCAKTALQKAGLLSSDGKPTGTEGIEAFTQMLTATKGKTHLLPIAWSTNSADPASCWRLWYTLFKQQNGDFLKDGQLSFEDLANQGGKGLQVIADWAKDGLIPKNTTYPSMVALFTAGRSVFMINGNWEVPTLVDLQKQNKLPFEYGIAPFPKLFDSQSTWADSHQFAIPNNMKKPASPEKVAAALKFVAYVVKQLTWAGGGHIPAYLPVQESDAHKQMSPNNQYSAGAAKDVVFEPELKIFDQVYLLTQGGPYNSTMVVLLYMYRQAFQQNRGGYASAVAIVLVVIMLLISALQFRLLQGRRTK